MELTEKITLDMLTKDSVSILRQQFVNLNGQLTQVGQNIRNAYMNNPSGRTTITEILPEEYSNAILAVWGDSATVEDPPKDIISEV